jgi:2-polyprenyl-3-methyl-5-hydroxy-6-metoxy-1,4-benzoquinol methylase
VDALQQRLGSISGGRILDVATGAGRFARTLAEAFRDYQEIVGIDINEEFLARAKEEHPNLVARFHVMSAEQLAFEQAAFDTVAISNALHHMADPVTVLQEMRRVLKSHGLFVVREMKRETDTPEQETHILFHTVLARIDRLLGQTHSASLPKSEILEMVRRAGVEIDESFEDAPSPGELLDRDAIDQNILRLDERLELTSYLAEHNELKGEVAAVKDRMLTVGQSPPVLVYVLGRKPA